MTGTFLSLIRRLAVARRAATSLEFASITLPLFVLLLGVMEIGSVVRVKAALLYATTNAARCASINATICGTADSVAAYAVTQAQGLAVSASNFTLSTDTCGKKVSATMPFPVDTHSVLKTGLSISVFACYPLQPACRVGDLVTPDGLPGVCRD
jgi:Flp pilus assembly protein TadG